MVPNTRKVQARGPTVARRLVLTLALALGLLTMLFVGQAMAVAVTYNLFATDGNIQMADGTPLYIYGFVGGRSTSVISYQQSITWAGGAVSTPSPNPGGLVTAGMGAIPAGAKWPSPTGGPVAAGIESQLIGNAQMPAPLIYCNVGDVVTINLKNLGVTAPAAPNDPHTIHLHGLDVDASNDGVPETSVATVPANSPAGTPGAGNVVVYMFTPTKAGTYMYHCHQEADIHVQMGMYGALIVYNAGDPRGTLGPGDGGGVAGTMDGWKFDKDVVMFLTDIDVRQHESERLASDPAFNPVDYKPQYWMINGLSFPNTIHTSLGGPTFTWTDWIAAHPGYDPLITGSITKVSLADGVPGEKVLIHVINMGYEAQPMHMHGFHGKILGSDQRDWIWANSAIARPSLWPAPTPWGQGLEKQTLLVGSGESYEWMINFGLTPKLTVSPSYPVKSQTKYWLSTKRPAVNTTTTAVGVIPVPGEPQPFTYIGGPPVMGLWGPIGTDALPVATGATPLANAQVFPFHNHDDYKATNNGVYPGGQFTAIIPQP